MKPQLQYCSPIVTFGDAITDGASEQKSFNSTPFQTPAANLAGCGRKLLPMYSPLGLESMKQRVLSLYERVR